MDREKQLSKLLLEMSREIIGGSFQRENELNKVLEEAKREQFIKIEAKAYINLASYRFQKGFYDEAITLFGLSLKIAEALKDLDFRAIILANRAQVYSNIGKKIDAINDMFESLSLWNEFGDKRNQMKLLLNIGIQFSQIGDFKQSEKYFFKAKQIAEEISRPSANLRANFGALYYKMGQHTRALEEAQLGLDLALELNDLYTACYCYLILAKINILIKDSASALQHIESAISTAKPQKFHQHLLEANVLKSELLLSEKKYKEAKEVIEPLIDKIEKAKDNITSLDANKVLFEVYKKDGDFKKALFHHERLVELRDKETGIDRKNNLDSLEAKYQNELKEKEKEILRLQKIEMEQKAIRAQLNPHFFFNALNSINKFILDNDQANASKFLQSFSGLMRKTLENSEEMFITIEDEIEFLKDYLSLEQLRCNNSFQFEFIVNEEIEEDFEKIPTMLLQPFVENAIKHGVNGIENGRISISFKIDENENLLCTVEDNGVGIKVKKRVSEHKSMATKLLQERIIALKEQFKVNFEIKTINLVDLKKGISGTRVELVIPKI